MGAVSRLMLFYRGEPAALFSMRGTSFSTVLPWGPSSTASASESLVSRASPNFSPSSTRSPLMIADLRSGEMSTDWSTGPAAALATAAPG